MSVSVFFFWGGWGFFFGGGPLYVFYCCCFGNAFTVLNENSNNAVIGIRLLSFH